MRLGFTVVMHRRRIELIHLLNSVDDSSMLMFLFILFTVEELQLRDVYNKQKMVYSKQKTNALWNPLVFLNRMSSSPENFHPFSRKNSLPL